MPLGTFSLGLDGLSAFFLLPILGLGALSAIYGLGYLRPYRDSKSLGASWFQFDVLVASMVMVVLARNALLFLVAWEVMSLSSFFLVAFENEKSEVRKASWTYLIATHIGTCFLFVMFLLLGQNASDLDFSRLGGLTPELGGVCFVSGRRRIRDESRHHSVSRLVARSASGRSQPCLGADVRRDDQNRHLRHPAHAPAFLARRNSGGDGRSLPSDCSPVCWVCFLRWLNTI